MEFLSNAGPGEKVKLKSDVEYLILYNVVYASALIEEGSYVGRADPTYKHVLPCPEVLRSMLGRSTRYGKADGTRNAYYCLEVEC